MTRTPIRRVRAHQAPDNSMERTRFFRRPVVWIILVIAGAIALSSLFTGGPSYHRVDTSVALQQLNNGPKNSISEVVFQDKEQTLQINLAQPAKFGDTTTNRIEAQFPSEVGDQIWNDVQNAQTAQRINGPVDTQVSGSHCRAFKEQRVTFTRGPAAPHGHRAPPDGRAGPPDPTRPGGLSESRRGECPVAVSGGARPDTGRRPGRSLG